MIQPLEFGPIGREGPASVGGNPGDYPLEWHVQPDGDAVLIDDGAIMRIGEGPAARRHDDMRRPYLIQQHRALRGAEVRLAAPRENIRDRHVLTLLDLLVDVEAAPVET